MTQRCRPRNRGETAEERRLSSPAWAAAIRTAILSLSAIILAALGSLRHLRELTWLVYPVLVVTGVKLLLEDLRHDQPLALFVSFAFLGVALIVAPRLLRRPAPQPGA